jgi:tRNA uridine 5-carboxymethylaminomethyl modification enzyme
LCRPEFVVERSEGYIGVLIDDLVLKGADEPYRMFTSRAEYRLLLREDNADMRLSERAYRLGLLPEASFRRFEEKREAIARENARLEETFYYPTDETNESLRSVGTAELKDRTSARQLLKRPEIDMAKLCALKYEPQSEKADVLEQVEIQVKYEGYIKRDLELLDAYSKNEGLRIPKAFEYQRVGGLSTEALEKLSRIRPETLGQALRIPGVTPAAVAAILLQLRAKDVRDVAPSA